MRLVSDGEDVFEVFGEDSPHGSRFLANRTGRVRRRIALLEHQLAKERAELARLKAEAVTLAAAGHTLPTPLP